MKRVFTTLFLFICLLGISLPETSQAEAYGCHLNNPRESGICVPCLRYQCGWELYQVVVWNGRIFYVPTSTWYYPCVGMSTTPGQAPFGYVWFLNCSGTSPGF